MNYSSRAGLASFDDEVFVEDCEIPRIWIERIENAIGLKELRIDTGGGVWTMLASEVIETCENSAETLLSLLGMKKAKNSVEEIQLILDRINYDIKTKSAYAH